MMQGKVIKSIGADYHVCEPTGQVYVCKLRGRLRLLAAKLTKPVVVGDEVLFGVASGQATGAIHKVLPRTNYLLRRSTHKRAYGQLIAANLDQALLVINAVHWAAAPTLIDQFLVMTEAFEVCPGVVYNKLDLLDTAQREALNAQRQLYQSLGYMTLAISALKGTYMDQLRQCLQGKVSSLTGHSGVGKSFIINTLAPTLQQAVAPPTRMAQRGQHTTTHTSLLPIAPHTFVIDTPGVQELMPYNLDKALIGHYFPEIRRLMADCKFHNCTHQHEPACAVLQALAQGYIARSRYDSYLRMQV